MRRVWIVLTALMLAACNRPLRGTPPETASETPIANLISAGETVEQSIASNNATRSFRLHLPTHYQSGISTPLVINFHGLNSNARQEEFLSAMSPKADAEGFIVVYPEGVDQLWRDGPGSDDVQFVRDLIAHLRGEYTIDPKQIFATGISNGGGMANRVGCDLSEVIAAIGPVSGAYNAWKICKPGRPVPVVAFHGTADNIVPYEGVGLGNAAPPIPEWASAWAERDGCVSTPTTFSQGEVTGETWGNCEAGAEVVLYTIAGKGHSWPGSAMPAQITTRDINATDVIWDFFKSHPMP